MKNSNRPLTMPVRTVAVALAFLTTSLAPPSLAGSRFEGPPYIGGSVGDAWSSHQVGYDGTGITVAVLDSGIDYTHANFVNQTFLDYDTDGDVDVIFAGGPGSVDPNAYVYDRRDGTLISTFQPFGPGWQGGVTLTTGNVAGNKRRELLTSTQTNFGQVNFFRTNGNQAGFLIPNQGFTGGVQVFAHPLIAGGRDELVVVPQSQSGSIQVLNPDGTVIVPGGLNPFGPKYNGGMDAALGESEGIPIMVMTRLAQRSQLVGTYTWVDTNTDGRRTLGLEQTGQFKHGFGKKGAHLALVDVDGDGNDEIVVGARARKRQSIRIFRLDGTLLGKYAPFDKPMALTDVAASPPDE